MPPTLPWLVQFATQARAKLKLNCTDCTKPICFIAQAVANCHTMLFELLLLFYIVAQAPENIEIATIQIAPNVFGLLHKGMQNASLCATTVCAAIRAPMRASVA